METLIPVDYNRTDWRGLPVIKFTIGTHVRTKQDIAVYIEEHPHRFKVAGKMINTIDRSPVYFENGNWRRPTYPCWLSGTLGDRKDYNN